MLTVAHPRKIILSALVVIAAAVAIGGAGFAIAQNQETANVEVRVWEDVNDPERNYISARPEGGSWRTLGTIPLPLTDGVSSSGRFRYGDITLAVPLPDASDGSGSTRRLNCSEANALGFADLTAEQAEALGIRNGDRDGDGSHCDAPPGDLSWSGTGERVIRASLEEARYVCNSRIAGNTHGRIEAHFAIDFDPVSGRDFGGGLLVNETVATGEFQSVVPIPRPGEYLIEITAQPTGRWELSCSR